MKVKIRAYEKHAQTVTNVKHWWADVSGRKYIVEDIVRGDQEHLFKWSDKFIFGVAAVIEKLVTSPYCRIYNKIHDSRYYKRVNVKLDRWDTWSMSETLAEIIVPMLTQLQQTKHGAPFVDAEDVPEHLRPATDRPSDGSVDETHFDRWDWVLNEMIEVFTLIKDGKLDHTNHMRIDNGTRLFGKYYQNLWD